MTGKERREQLLDIGRPLFAERGFDGPSIEEIAAQAGVSKPAVYEHFGGKEGLYAVVVDREGERPLTMATTSLAGGRTPGGWVLAWGRCHRAAAAATPGRSSRQRRWDCSGTSTTTPMDSASW